MLYLQHSIIPRPCHSWGTASPLPQATDYVVPSAQEFSSVPSVPPR